MPHKPNTLWKLIKFWYDTCFLAAGCLTKVFLVYVQMLSSCPYLLIVFVNSMRGGRKRNEERRSAYKGSRRNLQIITSSVCSFLSIVSCLFCLFFQDFSCGRVKCYHIPGNLYEKDGKQFICVVQGWRQYLCFALFLLSLQWTSYLLFAIAVIVVWVWEEMFPSVLSWVMWMSFLFLRRTQLCEW